MNPDPRGFITIVRYRPIKKFIWQSNIEASSLLHRLAKALVLARLASSRSQTSTTSGRAFSMTLRILSWPLMRSREVIMSFFGFISRSCRAVSRPRPVFTPVTRTVLPVRFMVVDGSDVYYALTKSRIAYVRPIGGT